MLLYDEEKDLGVFRKTRSAVEGPYPSRRGNKKPTRTEASLYRPTGHCREPRLQSTHDWKPLVDARWWMTHFDAHILKEG